MNDATPFSDGARPPRSTRRELLGRGAAAAVGGLVASQVVGGGTAEANGPYLPPTANDGHYIVVAAADAPASVRSQVHADFLCDNVNDEVEINRALSRAADTASTIGRGTVGGAVLLVGRKFTIGSPILVPTQTALRGQYGKAATWIVASATFAGGATTGMIQNATADTQYIEVSDLGLQGSGKNTSGVALFTNAGQEWDSFHVVKNLFIMNVGVNGLRVENAPGGRCRGNHFSEIRVIDAGADGVVVRAPDSFYDRIDVGSSGTSPTVGNGFSVLHANNRFVNCKSWFSTGHGFFIDGARDNQFSACEAQDNAGHGFYVSSGRTAIAACAADSNGRGTGTGDGFYVDATGCVIQGTASDKREGGATIGQRYGVNIVGSAKVIVQVATAGNFTAPSIGTGGPGSVVNVIDG